VQRRLWGLNWSHDQNFRRALSIVAAFAACYTLINIMRTLILTLGLVQPWHSNTLSEIRHEVANDATSNMFTVGEHVQQPTMALNPAYRFHCIWQGTRQPALASWTRDSWAKALGLHKRDNLYADPCLLGLTKLGWAVILTVFSMAVIFFCIPLLLIVSRRRPPGQPLIPGCCTCLDCCCKPEMNLGPPLQLVTH